MSKRQSLILLGVIVMSFLFLGFYEYIDKMIAIASGLLIIFISYKMKPDSVKTKDYSFVENKNTETVITSDIENKP